MSLPYFPLMSDAYEMPMNAQAGVSSLIEVEESRYLEEIVLKNEILASDFDYYFQCPTDCEPLAWEAIELLLPNMAEALPHYFSLDRKEAQWKWKNNLLETETNFTLGDSQSLLLSPLDWIGREVQEDLILMRETETGDSICAAGQLCFGSAWSLEEKLGRSFLETHDPVPEFRERIGATSDLLMRHLKPERPVSRLNWSVTSASQLNLAPKLKHEWQRSREGITPENVGSRIFFRVERQTLTRLPKTRGVLFTIHTYIDPLEEVISDPARLKRLTSVLRDYPESMKLYKGMTPYFDTLLGYLEKRIERLIVTTHPL